MSAPQNTDGKQEVLASSDPTLAVGRQASTGDDAVHMGMEEQLTGPGMQHAGDAKLGAEPARIATELEQRFARTGEEQVEEECTVGERERTQLGRQAGTAG